MYKVKTAINKIRTRVSSIKITKKNRIIIGICLLLLLLVGLSAVAYKKSSLSNNSKTKQVVIIDGKEYSPEFLTTRFSQEAVNETQIPAREEKVKILEQKILDSLATRDDYLALAQTYLKLGNKTKAIENYQRAIDVTPPDTTENKQFVASNQEIIETLKKSTD